MSSRAMTASEPATQNERFHMTRRLRALAQAAAQRWDGAPECQRIANQTHAYFELYQDLPLRERQAKSLAYALVREPVLLFPGERVNGIFYRGSADPQLRGQNWGEHSVQTAAERRVAEEAPEIAPYLNQWPERKPEAGKASFILGGGAAPGHIAWDYGLVLSLGVEGIMERHREALAAATDPNAKDYFQGVLTCWDAALEWNRQHVDALRLLRDRVETTEDGERLEQSIRVMERVPAKPARSFFEAVQSFYFQWLCVMYEVPYGGNSPGRLDYYLWPYLKEEYESGALSYQDAAELVAELFIKMDERVHLQDGHVNTIVVGGVAPDGSDAVSPLTYIMLDVFEQLDLTHPAVYTRISDVNPPEYVDRCVQYSLTGGNRSQILADEAIIRAMTRDGRMPFEHAAMYICGGCMEISPQGMNSDLAFTFHYSVPKTLELLITGGECLTTGQKRRLDVAGSLRDYSTFDGFYAAFEEEIRRVLHAKFRCVDIYSEEMARCRPAFIQSSMIADCLERGRNLQDGGARYGDYAAAPVGVQNAADSLYAIKVTVFDEGFCAPDELIDALRADFVGHEPLRRRLLAVPKYGVGDPGADGMMHRLVASVCQTFDSYRNRHGRYVKPMIFTFVWAPQVGQSLGASADGRRSGAPVGHGLTPQTAGLKEGITASINSYATLPHDVVSGGSTTMWDMDPQWINHDLLRSILKTFIQKGGHIFQGNMTSVDDLRAALDDPDAHGNVIVRVGGYSARFVSLDRALQMEIIERYRHCG